MCKSEALGGVEETSGGQKVSYVRPIDRVQTDVRTVVSTSVVSSRVQQYSPGRNSRPYNARCAFDPWSTGGQHPTFRHQHFQTD
jgi:hypothetical protein